MKNINLPKLLSGRFILTVVSAIAFLQFSNCVCQLLIEKANEITISDLLNIGNIVLIVISNIFTFYFTRERKSYDEKQDGDK